MANFEIGLSGLSVAQQALDTIGTNITNAGTPGYHRQQVNIVPVVLDSTNGTAGGARVAGVTRSVDPLAENVLLSQQPLQGQISQELATLQTVEDSLGAIGSSSGGLAGALSGFFNSLSQLAGQLGSQPYLQQVATAGSTLAGEFHSLDGTLGALCDSIDREAQNQVAQVNEYSQQIAQLNTQIAALVHNGQNANILMDQRDEAVSQMSQLADVQVTHSSVTPGVVGVSAWGTTVVVDSQATELETGRAQDGQLGISVKGDQNYQTRSGSGSLGALLGLQNGMVKDIRDNLDTLAREVVTQVNQYHVQGVGADGSFTELSGSAVGSGALSSWGAGISAGQFYVRITNQATGQVTRCPIAVNLDDTVSDVASRLSAVQVGADHPLAATVAEDTLHIQATAGYKFDFLPAPTPQPAVSTLTGTSGPTISGSYDGPANQAYTLTVLGGGQVGVSDGLQIQVKNGAGETVHTLSVGSGYAPGDTLQIDHGLTVAMGSGTLNAGESFQVQALAQTDPTGFLAAAGINTFFRGSSAGTIDLDPQIAGDPGRIATSLGAEQADNANVNRMAGLQTTALPALGGATPTDYFDQLVTNVGQSVQVRQTRKTALDGMIQQLQSQGDTAGAVDINQEAANLLVYQRMFQSVARFLTTLDQTLQYLNSMMT